MGMKTKSRRQTIVFWIAWLGVLVTYAGITAGVDFLHNHRDLPVRCRAECPAHQWLILSQEPSPLVLGEGEEISRLPFLQYLSLDKKTPSIESHTFSPLQPRAPPVFHPSA